ncbi:hypothetical protein [Aureispira anguillae]|nr:hypothetical protein [Aureispira anguillae]
MEVNKAYKIVDTFINTAKSDTLSIEDVFNDYIINANVIKAHKEMKEAYLVQLKELRQDLAQQTYAVLPWREAEDKQAAATMDLLKNEEDKNNVFVIFVEDEPKYYILVKENEGIQSIIPMRKVDTIIGWL